MAAHQSGGLPNVPVAIGAFTASTELRACTDALWTGASLRTAPARPRVLGGTQSSGYRIHPAGEPGAGISLELLVSKPMRGLPMGSAVTAGAAAATEAAALYSVQWSVSMAQPSESLTSTGPIAQRLRIRANPLWMLLGSAGRPAQTLQATAGPLSLSCGHGLAVLQQAIGQQESATVRVHLITQAGTCGDAAPCVQHNAGRSQAAALEADAAAAAAGGLLRVAASENPAMQLAASEYAAAGIMQAPLSGGQDAFGARSAGGALKFPLLARMADARQQPTQGLRKSSSITITGGLGGASHSLNCFLHLAMRSAMSSYLHTYLADGTAGHSVRCWRVCCDPRRGARLAICFKFSCSESS